MQFDILTLFPAFFHGPLYESILRRAWERGILSFRVIDIRDFTEDRHREADDYPYGGGGGMVMKPEPLSRAIKAMKDLKPATRIIYLTPQGPPLDQEKALELSRLERTTLICGHYEGIDERVREKYVDEEISIGDYVLTGGEPAAIVLIDSVARMIPGVLGNEASFQNDSFYTGLLDFPHYTRPEEFEGLKVPEVLLSGHHEKIRNWRRKKALERTAAIRPDLLKRAPLTEEERALFPEKDGSTPGIPGDN